MLIKRCIYDYIGQQLPQILIACKNIYRFAPNQLQVMKGVHMHIFANTIYWCAAEQTCQ